MIVYHGTSRNSAQNIKSNGIMPIGGGELGKGFYVGTLEYPAFCWAYNICGKGNSTVIEFDIDDNGFIGIEPLILSHNDAVEFRKQIKSNQQERDFLFHRNAIWADVVGISKSGFEQIKFEEREGINFINNATKSYTEK